MSSVGRRRGSTTDCASTARVFDEKWKDFQFSYLGPNALTIIANAGQAEIKGMEMDLEFAATQNLTLLERL